MEEWFGLGVLAPFTQQSTSMLNPPPTSFNSISVEHLLLVATLLLEGSKGDRTKREVPCRFACRFEPLRAGRNNIRAE
jgi:hypothetical protein